MLVNTGNYFEQVKKIGEENLSAPVKKMHDLIAKVTQDGKDWSKYQTFKSAWDKQFEMIDLLAKGKGEKSNVAPVKKESPKEETRAPRKAETKVNGEWEEKAHAAAIKLIEAYVKRGDSFDDIRSGQMGAHNGEFSAMIKGRNIYVDRIGKTDVDYSFTLQRIFNEIKESMKGGKKNKAVHHARHKASHKLPHFKGKGVEMVSPEVIFIKRFALLNGKEKNRQQVLNFVKSIQKAIAEKKIRKSTKYSKVIQFIQTQLVKTYNKMGESIGFSFTEKDYIKYLKMAGAEYLLPSVRFIKSYIGMLGQSITKQRAAALLERINAAFEKKQVTPSDKYIKHLRQVMGALERFLKTGDSPQVSEAQLNGLEGVLEACGCDLYGSEYHESYGSALEGVDDPEVETPTTPRNTILNSMDVLNLKADKLDFTGKWRDFIGNPSKGFTMMIYGKPKFGKSYLAVEFAGYLARHHGKVLYVAKEEGFDDTIQDKIREKGVGHENLDVSDYLPKSLSGYDFVFLDSINKLALSPAEVEKLEEKYPSISFIYIFQCLKDGNYKGSMEFSHNVDAIVEVPEKGLATQYGRYNQGGEMRIFDPPTC